MFKGNPVMLSSFVAMTILKGGHFIAGNLRVFAIRSVSDSSIARHFTVEMSESYSLTTKADITVLKERTRVRHCTMMDSNIKVRMENIMKTWSAVGAMLIFTINRCNRL